MPLTRQQKMIMIMANSWYAIMCVPFETVCNFFHIICDFRYLYYNLLAGGRGAWVHTSYERTHHMDTRNSKSKKDNQNVYVTLRVCWNRSKIRITIVNKCKKKWKVDKISFVNHFVLFKNLQPPFHFQFAHSFISEKINIIQLWNDVPDIHALFSSSNEISNTLVT